MIEISEQDYESVEEFKDGIINSFAEARGQPFGWGQFAFEALDNGERVGVVMGYWLYRLLERAEALAKELSLEGVALDTFGYQAPTYYEARGYVEHMVIPGKNRERDRIYFQKRLQGN
jgi:hypothetical protein